MAFFGLLFLVIPLALGIAGLFAGILAHRGQATAGTWTLIFSAITYLVSTVVMGAAQYLFMTSLTSSIAGASGPELDWEFYELLLVISMSVFVLSIFAFSIGILLMGLQWKSLSHEAAELERLAQKLAMERDQAPTPVGQNVG